MWVSNEFPDHTTDITRQKSTRSVRILIVERGGICIKGHVVPTVLRNAIVSEREG